VKPEKRILLYVAARAPDTPPHTLRVTLGELGRVARIGEGETINALQRLSRGGHAHVRWIARGIVEITLVPFLPYVTPPHEPDGHTSDAPTARKVREILAAHAEPRRRPSQRELAHRFGVGVNLIGRIIRGTYEPPDAPEEDYHP